jgi:hypothetical protein
LIIVTAMGAAVSHGDGHRVSAAWPGDPGIIKISLAGVSTLSGDPERKTNARWIIGVSGISYQKGSDMRRRIFALVAAIGLTLGLGATLGMQAASAQTQPHDCAAACFFT